MDTIKYPAGSSGLPVWHNATLAANKPNVFDRATANVLADSDQEYIVHSRKRNILRAVLVCLVVIAVAAFTVLKYITEESLRAATYTVRINDYHKLTQAEFARSVCPCTHDEFAWSAFVSYRAPLAKDLNSTRKFCETAFPSSPPPPPPPPPPDRTSACPFGLSCGGISPGSSGSPDSEPSETPELLADRIANVSDPVSAFIGSAATLHGTDNFVPLLTCGMAVTRLVGALSRDPLDHAPGFGDTFSTGRYLSKNDTQRRLAGFAGSVIRTYQQDAQAQLALLFGLTADFEDDASDGFRQTTAAVAQQLAVTTGETALDFTGTVQDAEAFSSFLEMVLEALVMDYDKFGKACQPQYCDVTKVKSVWARITEFLSLLGGLWTIFLGIGIVVWWLLDHALPLR